MSRYALSHADASGYEKNAASIPALSYATIFASNSTVFPHRFDCDRLVYVGRERETFEFPFCRSFL